MRTPFELGKCIILEYTEVAFGFACVNVSGLASWMSKRKCCRIGPKQPRARGLIVKGNKIMFWSRMSPMTVSPMVVIPFVRVGSFELLLFVFLYVNGHWSLMPLCALLVETE